MALGLPLIVWGSAEDIGGSGWTTVAAPARTTGQTDPFGGTSAVLITDDSAIDYEGYSRSGGTVAGGRADFLVFVKPGTSTVQLIQIRETAGSTVIGFVTVNTASTPVFAIGSGSWPVLASATLANGFYALLLSLDGLTDGTGLALELFPAGASAASMGTATFYLQNGVLLDYLDGPVSDAVPREGSVEAQAVSGVEDAWVLGPNYRLTATMRGIAARPQATPVAISGWEGMNTAVGVNCGVAAMLRAGRAATSLRFVPDRSASATYTDSYLQPDDDTPEREGAGPYRRHPIVLWNASAPYEGVP